MRLLNREPEGCKKGKPWKTSYTGRRKTGGIRIDSAIYKQESLQKNAGVVIGLGVGVGKGIGFMNKK